MHFCESVTLFNVYSGDFGSHVPKKIGLNWFMPALAKSKVGSSCGTTGEDGTIVCACSLSKKEVNVFRTFAADQLQFSV